jgi:DNA polymerase V
MVYATLYFHMEQNYKKNKSLPGVEILGTDNSASKKSFPLLMTYVQAGFPSPADDYIEQKLDLNDYLVKHPAATFFVRVQGDSMMDAGIRSGDILIVDRALPVIHGAIVIAQIQGEFTVKHVEKRGQEVYLVPANKSYKPLLVTPEMDIEIWGIVSYIIHKAL